MKHILFDLDGTITDPKVGITKSIQYALSKFEIQIDDSDKLKSLIGPHIYNTFIEEYGFSEEKSELAVSYFREYYSEKGLFESHPYPDIEKTLEGLKNQNFRLAIATSKPTELAEKILKHFNLDRYLSHIVGSNLDNTRINKDEIITECIKLFGDDSKNHYIMIGDRKHDILGAKKVGIGSIGVLYGYGSKEELEAAGADKIIDKHEELLDIENNNFSSFCL